MGARHAFVFAPDRCTGCEACRVACGIENAAGLDTGWRTITTLNPSRHPALPTRHLSLACNHCETPVCALGCPANAYHRDAVTGAVLLEPDQCIGCRYCSWLCPYDAPKFDAGAGVMTKCTFCSPRLAAGGQPACTQACPTGALSLGERATCEPHHPLLGLDARGLGPALRVVDPRQRSQPGVVPPALAIDAWLAGGDEGAPTQPVAPPKIQLRSEWTLVLFTVVLPALVAWLGAGLALPDRAPEPVAFLGAGGLVMALSTLHLGRPSRAWRAILNWRTSWLSREALLAGAFVGLGGTALLAPHLAHRWPELAALAAGAGPFAFVAGLGLAVAIDGVYAAIPRRDRFPFHSADAALATLLQLGLALGVGTVAWTASAVTLALLVVRVRRGRFGLHPTVAVVRGGLLLAALAVAGRGWSWALLLAVASQALDRCAFYVELGPTTPASRMADEVDRFGRP
ncbi:MAG: 4Fe-4S binding protein [Vicinamibacteria bacterium]|nr:4Fe-4S binding protein [Vicinamibacteria bacterium]